jgi:hypothetical protein
MLVHRIEERDGRREGPFSSGLTFTSCPMSGRAPNDGPRPATSGISFNDRLHVFGCAEKKHMRDVWFPSYHCQEFDDRDYVLRTYDVPDRDVLRGDVQVAFDRTNARVIDEVPCISLYI